MSSNSAPPHALAPRSAGLRRRAWRAGVVSITLVAGLALTGCGVRVDTPPPAEPSPDAQELVRSATVDDAQVVEGLARSASADLSGSNGDERVVTALDQVADFAAQHVVQLGGTYDSGLPDAPTEASVPSPDATDAAATPADVVDALAGASVRARASADSAAEGGLARLLASVSTSQILSAERLASLTGTDLPETIVPKSPVPPSDLPEGLPAAQLTTLVESEDAAGYAYELTAARSDGTGRDRAERLALGHRDLGERWAALVGVDGQSEDPRRVAYAVPDTSATKLGRKLEKNLATTYTTLVGEGTVGQRAALVDLLARSQRAATAWGSPLVAFPGMPERADS